MGRRFRFQKADALESPAKKFAAGKRLQPADYRGKVWLTRTRPEIDRVGSAWLIRKFIDPEAKFVFGDEPAHPGAIPYDMLDVEFSHHGDHCTFETLIDCFGIRDRAVQKLAELIHDADLEDESFREAFLFRLKLGFINFGGPTGQIAVMHTDLVEKKKWIIEARFLRALNYCMLLPGPEAQQLATYVGWLTWGGIVAGAFFVIPL